MKRLKFTLLLWLCAGLVSCSLNPAWILNPNPYDYDEDRKKFTDTPRNRLDSLTNYLKMINSEASGEKMPWDTIWRDVFDALNRYDDNAKLYQSYIIRERRKRGLPELKFL